MVLSVFSLILLLAFRVHGKPSLFHPPFLFEYLEDAPQAGASHDSENRTEQRVGCEQACDDGGHACQGEDPPASGAEIIFALDDDGVEDTDYHEGEDGYEEAGVVHGEDDDVCE